MGGGEGSVGEWEGSKGRVVRVGKWEGSEGRVGEWEGGEGRWESGRVVRGGGRMGRGGEAGTDGDYIVTAGLLLWGTGTQLEVD